MLKSINTKPAALKHINFSLTANAGTVLYTVPADKTMVGVFSDKSMVGINGAYTNVAPSVQYTFPGGTVFSGWSASGTGNLVGVES